MCAAQAGEEGLQVSNTSWLYHVGTAGGGDGYNLVEYVFLNFTVTFFIDRLKRNIQNTDIVGSSALIFICTYCHFQLLFGLVSLDTGQGKSGVSF